MAQELFGPYQMETLIGKGGMGEVWRAFDTVRKRTVAIKRLPHHLAADAEFQARFRRESELAAQLEHPHVVPIHDYGEIDGRLFIDMRLVDGPNLATLLAASGRLTPARAVDIVSQLAGALDAAHTQGMVHRDIKPSNVLLATHSDSADFVYLSDFGIARALSGGTSLTVTGATVGSVEYMAPERFLATGDDHRADIYALACVLYETLTGAKPFAGRDRQAMMYAHVNAEPPIPSRYRPDVPLAMDDVIAQGMAKDPDQRPATAGQFAAAARRALGDTTAHRAPVAPAAVPGQGATVHQGAPVHQGATALGDTDSLSAIVLPSHSAPVDAGVPGATRRARHGAIQTPILTLLAVAALAAVLLLSNISVAGIGNTTPNTQAQPAPNSALEAPPAAVSEGVFIGRSDNNVALTIAIKGGRAVGYLCDGNKIEAWLEGTVRGDQVDLRGKKGAAVTGTLSTDTTFSMGTVTISSEQSPYLAEIAPKPAGLYEGRGRVDGVDNRIGWIVFPDGRQIGIRNVNGERSPAPPLDLDQLTADGSQTSVKPIGGDDVVLGQ